MVVAALAVVPWPSALVGPAVGAAPAAAANPPALCLVPPVDGEVVDPYREPPCPYCAGHRGITYTTARGGAVGAAAAGTVVVSGAVAGVRYVVVAHAGGWRTTYGRLAAVAAGLGRVVRPGEIIGRSSGQLHFGLRRGDEYVDPTPFLGAVRRRARLVPLDGTRPRPSPGVAGRRCSTAGQAAAPSAGAAGSLLRGVVTRGPR